MLGPAQLGFPGFSVMDTLNGRVGSVFWLTVCSVIACSYLGLVGNHVNGAVIGLLHPSGASYYRQHFGS